MRILNLTDDTRKDILEDLLKRSPNNYSQYEKTVSEILIQNILKAVEQTGVKTVALAGGVSANSYIRKEFLQLEEQGIKIYMPDLKLCTDNAAMIGVETRTSAPVRILRDRESLQHVRIEGLYPCGEGAGYAGGIVSAGIDGERCAEALAMRIKN